MYMHMYMYMYVHMCVSTGVYDVCISVFTCAYVRVDVLVRERTDALK